jgi:two-component system response regulator FixJ
MEKGLIHLVDDEPVVRSMLVRLITSGGYRVREYASGADLIAAADTLEDGCILLDINMPEPDGFAVAKALIEREVELPVVMMTGSGDLTLLAWKAGVSGFIPKPFGRSEILSVLDQVTMEQFVATAS